MHINALCLKLKWLHYTIDVPVVCMCPEIVIFVDQTVLHVEQELISKDVLLNITKKMLLKSL